METRVVLEVWQLIAGLFLAVAGTSILSIAGLGVVASRLRNDQATMAAIEGLVKSVPMETVEMVNQFSRALLEIGRLIDEATDNVPIADKIETENMNVNVVPDVPPTTHVEGIRG